MERTIFKKGRRIVAYIDRRSDGFYWVVFGKPSDSTNLSWRHKTFGDAEKFVKDTLHI